jgi:DNA-binding transcriptional ArsR family regulator
MTDLLDIAQIAALIGDPARANMLLALGDGRALPAGELAAGAGIMPQTASAHLARLTEAGLLSVVAQGRHRYYRLASPLVATALEAVMAVAAAAPARQARAARIDPGLRQARTCYTHLAGRLGVGLAEALAVGGHLILSEDGGMVTARGRDLLARFGIPLGRDAAPCRICVDWSERRPHLAGKLGTALCARCFALGWIVRVPGGRQVAVTPAGAAGFQSAFGMDAAAIGAAAGSAMRAPGTGSRSGTRLARNSSAQARQENRSA